MLVKVGKYGDRTVEVALEDGATVRAALEAADYSDEPVDKIRVNGIPASMETALSGGSIVTIVGKIEGGV